jgi:effector-binding domain-containing protein
MRHKLAIAFLALTTATFVTSLAGALRADTPTKPATAKAETPSLIGEVHVMTLPAMTIVYTSAETTFDKIGDTAMKGVGKIEAEKAKGTVKMDGPSVFVYRNITAMDKPFTLEMGLVVPADSKEVADLKVKKLGEFKCATVLYTGPLSNLPKVYEKVIGEVMAKGLEMTGENREMYLFWDNPESANNVTWIQIGIK